MMTPHPALLPVVELQHSAAELRDNSFMDQVNGTICCWCDLRDDGCLHISVQLVDIWHFLQESQNIYKKSELWRRETVCCVVLCWPQAAEYLLVPVDEMVVPWTAHIATASPQSSLSYKEAKRRGVRTPVYMNLSPLTSSTRVASDSSPVWA